VPVSLTVAEHVQRQQNTLISSSQLRHTAYNTIACLLESQFFGMTILSAKYSVDSGKKLLLLFPVHAPDSEFLFVEIGTLKYYNWLIDDCQFEP